MRPVHKALLLSLLVAPGSGHFALKRPIAGGVWLVAFGWALFELIRSVLRAAAPLIESFRDRIATGELTPDVAALTPMVMSEVQAARVGGWPVWVLLALWALAALDVWRIGRATTSPDPAVLPPAA